MQAMTDNRTFLFDPMTHLWGLAAPHPTCVPPPISVHQVSREEGAQLAAEYGIQFFETSAKNDINVEKGFITIAREVKDRLMAADPNKKGPTITVTPKQGDKKTSCC